MLTIDLDYQTYEFEEGATIQVKPLSFKAYQQVFAFLNTGGLSKEGDNAEAVLKQMSSPKLHDIFKSVLPKHCKDIAGVEIKKNDKKIPLTVDTLISEGAFIMWGVSIMAHLFSISSLNKGESETVKKQQPES